MPWRRWPSDLGWPCCCRPRRGRRARRPPRHGDRLLARPPSMRPRSPAQQASWPRLAIGCKRTGNFGSTTDERTAVLGPLPRPSEEGERDCRVGSGRCGSAWPRPRQRAICVDYGAASWRQDGFSSSSSVLISVGAAELALATWGCSRGGRPHADAAHTAGGSFESVSAV